MEIKVLLKKVNLLLGGAIVALVTLLAMGSSLIAFHQPERTISPLKDLSQEELVKRGTYLVNTSGCHDCHSPKVMTPQGPEPDPQRLLSGHPSDLPLPEVKKEAMKDWVLFNAHSTGIVGPWGVSFAANLTSDETGIGNWTEEQFLTSIQKGIYKGLEGSRPLLPPMPWQMYRNMTDSDLRSIFAYLKTTRPVRNIVPAPITPDQIP